MAVYYFHMNGVRPVIQTNFLPSLTGGDSASTASELSAVGVINKRRESWRKYSANKIASMTPVELAAHVEHKRLYDIKYRDLKREERMAYKADPKRKEKWNAIRREHYKKHRAHPKTPFTPEERKRRALESWKKYRIKRSKIPMKRLIGNMRTRLHCSVLGRAKKADTTMRLIGCTQEELRAHLESKFKPGMTWENYGRFGWHVDHIKPLSKCDLSTKAAQKIAFGLKNVQPLWWYENIKKSAKLLA